MKLPRLIFLLSLILLSLDIRSQSTFLDSFKKFGTKSIGREKTIDSLRRAGHLKGITNKDVKKSKVQALRQLDSLCALLERGFIRYKAEKGFDFNMADTLTLVYQTSVETQLREFIIISGRDTLSFKENWASIGLHYAVRGIEYVPFLDKNEVDGIRTVDSRDSLLTLITRRDLVVAKNLARENPVLDGYTTTVVLAKRKGEKYLIEDWFLPPFDFVPVVRLK
jgi:hypothetical protein